MNSSPLIIVIKRQCEPGCLECRRSLRERACAELGMIVAIASPTNNPLVGGPNCDNALRNTYKRTGLTLVEVICGLVLTGTLLVALVQAHSLHARQIRLAQERLAAVAALDVIITTWANQPNHEIPAPILAVPNHPDWLCRTELLPRDGTSSLNLHILSFAIYRNTSTPNARPHFPLASVEVAVTDAR